MTIRNTTFNIIMSRITANKCIQRYSQQGKDTNSSDHIQPNWLGCKAEVRGLLKKILTIIDVSALHPKIQKLVQFLFHFQVLL